MTRLRRVPSARPLTIRFSGQPDTTVVSNDRRHLTRPAKTKAAPAIGRGGFHLA
jgi:hypothetical protein